MTPEDQNNAARRILDSFDRNAESQPLNSGGQMGLDDGYAVASRIADARLARGDRIVGRKIGFTNRSIWPIYNVDAPVWNYVWDSTLHDIPQDGRVALPALPNLRLEPEIIFGIARSPEPGMSAHAFLDCIDWIAHGFEIVTSIYPGWTFTAPDAAAAQGMHGSLWLGPRVPAKDFTPAALEQFSLTLEGPDQTLTGAASDVLGGPLHALAHLIAEIPRMPGASSLTQGEVVTTGTLTDAVPISSGQRWRTRLDWLALPGQDIRIV